MCSLKIHDNVLLSRVSKECEHDSLYLSKVKLVNKIDAQSCKRNASKVKVQTETTKNQNNFAAVLVFNLT